MRVMERTALQGRARVLERKDEEIKSGESADRVRGALPQPGRAKPEAEKGDAFHRDAYHFFKITQLVRFSKTYNMYP